MDSTKSPPYNTVMNSVLIKSELMIIPVNYVITNVQHVSENQNVSPAFKMLTDSIHLSVNVKKDIMMIK